MLVTYRDMDNTPCHYQTALLLTSYYCGAFLSPPRGSWQHGPTHPHTHVCTRTKYTLHIHIHTLHTHTYNAHIHTHYTHTHCMHTYERTCDFIS